MNANCLKADGRDAIEMNFTVKNKKGLEVPDATNLLRFIIKGDAEILGVGNGDKESLEDERFLNGDYKRKLYNGKCQIIVKSGKSSGNIEIKATG